MGLALLTCNVFMPLSTKKASAKSYSGYAVKEAIHFEGADEQGYFVSVENEKEQIVLTVSDRSVV